MNFCSHCAQPVALMIPAGDRLERFVCANCGTIHYENPRIITGCVPAAHGKILLCRRAIEPRLGFWTIPAGFMENNETVQEGAAREAYEEALARVRIGSLLSVVHVFHVQQVHMMFRAELLNEDFGAGPESLEVRLYAPEEIPWDEFAFESARFTLKRYLEDNASNRESLYFHTSD